MKESLFKYLVTNQNEMNVFQVSEILGMAILLSMIIFVTYKLTYSGVLYNRKFNVSLVMITIVTTMVMIVIGSNIALSLGMVGALSIVRFRTAIKDPRDTTYIFWSIAIGLCVGTQNYTIAIIGSAMIFLVLVVLSIGGFGMNDKFILIIRGLRKNEEAMMKIVYKEFKGSSLRSKNSDEKNIELVYQVRIKKNMTKNYLHELYKVDGVENVNIVAQNGETIG